MSKLLVDIVTISLHNTLSNKVGDNKMQNNMWNKNLAGHVELKNMEDWAMENPNLSKVDQTRLVSTYCTGCGSCQKEIGVLVCSKCSSK